MNTPMHFFRHTIMPGFNFLAASTRPTINVWPYIVTYKSYYTPVLPLTTALMICLTVLVTITSRESTDTPFRKHIHAGPRNHVLHGVHIDTNW